MSPDPGGGNNLAQVSPSMLYPSPRTKPLPSCMETPPKEAEPEEEEEEPSSEHRPRIKHVCRRASVALGRAVFPGPQQLRLSALPDKEKQLQLQQEPGQDDPDLSWDQ